LGAFGKVNFVAKPDRFGILLVLAKYRFATASFVTAFASELVTTGSISDGVGVTTGVCGVVSGCAGVGGSVGAGAGVTVGTGAGCRTDTSTGLLLTAQTLPPP